MCTVIHREIKIIIIWAMEYFKNHYARNSLFVFIPAIIVVDEIKAWPRASWSTSNNSAAMNIKKTFIMLVQIKHTHEVSCSINISGNCTQIPKTHFYYLLLPCWMGSKSTIVSSPDVLLVSRNSTWLKCKMAANIQSITFLSCEEFF